MAKAQISFEDKHERIIERIKKRYDLHNKEQAVLKALILVRDEVLSSLSQRSKEDV